MAAVLLAGIFLLPQAKTGAVSAAVPDNIRVGLAYGGSALAEARLENSVGSGYRFGITDDAGVFTLLGSTEERKLTLRKTVGEGISPQAITVQGTDTGTVLFQFDGSAPALTVLPGADDTLKTETWFAKRKYFGSFRYSCTGELLTVINVLPREDYINCVISQEMSESWPLEALKAQAVCARSYAATCTGRHIAAGFDLCATTHCQAYPGTTRIGANTTQAAAETAGLYVWYNGAIASTYYTSSDGGATESTKNIWGGNEPHLVGVLDPWEATVEAKIPNYRWSVTWTKTDLELALQASGRPVKNLANVTVNPSPTGNAKSVTFTDASGESWTILGDKARIFLKTGSCRYTVSGGGVYYVDEGGTLPSVAGLLAMDGSGAIAPLSSTDQPYLITADGTEQLKVPPMVGDSFTFSGSGSGHNVGMSQWGAYAMAKAGKTYSDIMNFYFTGIEIR
ncbi:MAG: SpoIID/LytB domain-containing protein [Pseudoflavonifractor sp.]